MSGISSKITVWGTKDCPACDVANQYFQSRTDIQYTFADLAKKSNRNLLGKITGNDYNTGESYTTPIVQRCYTDEKGVFKCDVVTGFNKRKYDK